MFVLQTELRTASNVGTCSWFLSINLSNRSPAEFNILSQQRSTFRHFIPQVTKNKGLNAAYRFSN